MGTIGAREIELKVHGMTQADHGRVPGRLFANKLKQLIGALEAADIIANGKVLHDYVLSSMHMSEPTAVLAEIPFDQSEDGGSAIPVFSDAIEGIKTNDSRVMALAPVVKHVGLLTSGAESAFKFAEVRTAKFDVVRIDEFLRKRARLAREQQRGRWFDGAVQASFDGVLDYVDLRGAMPQLKLTLSAGGKEIDCVCRREDIEVLGDALHHRVRVYGRAIYTSESPLPIRVEVRTIEPVKKDADFSRWQGAFRPFSAESWEGDA